MMDYEERLKSSSDELFKNGKIGNTPLDKLVVNETNFANQKVAAKNIKRVVADLCPEDVLIKIKSSSFSMGDSVDVTVIHDQNLTKERQKQFEDLSRTIEAIIDIFSDGGMEDQSGVYHSGRNEFNKKYGSTKYVNCYVREYYDEDKISFLKKKSKIEKNELSKLLKTSKNEPKIQKRI